MTAQSRDEQILKLKIFDTFEIYGMFSGICVHLVKGGRLCEQL